MATSILLVIHVLVAVAIIGLVLIQQGRGADMGAAFGGGSQTLFGARGSANFLTRVTAILAAVFFFTSVSLAYIYSQRQAPASVTEDIQVQETVQEKPVDVGQDKSGTSAADDVPRAPDSKGNGVSSGDIPDTPRKMDSDPPAGDIPAAPAPK